jgi:hypothetical protein
VYESNAVRAASLSQMSVKCWGSVPDSVFYSFVAHNISSSQFERKKADLIMFIGQGKLGLHLIYLAPKLKSLNHAHMLGFKTLLLHH